jgi:8-oxo-dGTP diphosphatase
MQDQGIATPSGVIRISAAILTRRDGRTLLVRKRGTHAFMQPGGKIERGESPVDALCRELFEELGIAIVTADVQFIGRFAAPAANEPGYQVQADVFSIETNEPVQPGFEIEEVMWIDPHESGSVHLAPLTRDLMAHLCTVNE